MKMNRLKNYIDNIEAILNRYKNIVKMIYFLLGSIIVPFIFYYL